MQTQVEWCERCLVHRVAGRPRSSSFVVAPPALGPKVGASPHPYLTAPVLGRLCGVTRYCGRCCLAGVRQSRVVRAPSVLGLGCWGLEVLGLRVLGRLEPPARASSVALCPNALREPYRRGVVVSPTSLRASRRGALGYMRASTPPVNIRPIRSTSDPISTRNGACTS